MVVAPLAEVAPDIPSFATVTGTPFEAVRRFPRIGSNPVPSEEISSWDPNVMLSPTATYPSAFVNRANFTASASVEDGPGCEVIVTV